MVSWGLGKKRTRLTSMPWKPLWKIFQMGLITQEPKNITTEIKKLDICRERSCVTVSRFMHINNLRVQNVDRLNVSGLTFPSKLFGLTNNQSRPRFHRIRQQRQNLSKYPESGSSASGQSQHICFPNDTHQRRLFSNIRVRVNLKSS